MGNTDSVIAEWQRRADAAADRWARGLSDTRPPEQFVTTLTMPGDLRELHGRS